VSVGNGFSVAVVRAHVLSVLHCVMPACGRSSHRMQIVYCSCCMYFADISAAIRFGLPRFKIVPGRLGHRKMQKG
jgi:2-keto-3-deoxy-6-phosphogluconate aldolase